MQHLRILFQRLSNASLVINSKKCAFGVATVEFLGHHVSAAGTSPTAAHLDAIQRHLRPTTVKELQGFLGTINFYLRFVPSAARILKPLTDVLRGSPGPTTALEWSEDMEAAFAAAKAALCKTVSLAHPSPTAELALMVDASAEHVGASLQQRTAAGGPWQPLSFFSKKLEPAQTRYSAFDRELWVCFSGIRHFRHMLEGRRFILFTDHKPLTQALFRSSDPWTPRQCRQLSYIAEHTSDICHIADLDNVVADILSPLPAPSPAAACVKEPSGSQAAARREGKSNLPPSSRAAAVAAFDGCLDFLTIAANQLTCPDTLSAIRSPVLSIQPVVIDGVSVLCDTARGLTRPLVPRADRQQVFAAIHGLAHPGTRATRRLMTSRVVWRGMTSDIARWVRECQHCSRGKVTSQLAAPVQPVQVPARRFSHIHVDLVGPLPVATDGSTYLLTIIDRSTRWLEAVPLRNMETATCVEALISTWVSRYGVPSNITTDRARQFTSALWSGLCQKLGVTHITTAYHPQSNGMVERAHRQIKDALRPPGWSRVASTSPLGPTWPPCSSKGGCRHLFSRAGVWSCPHSSRAVPGNHGAVACRLHQAAAVFTSYSYKAGYVRGGRSLGPREADEGQVRVCEARRRGTAAGAPVPRAIQGAAGRGQVLHHQPQRPRGHGLSRPTEAAPGWPSGCSGAAGQRSSSTQCGRSGLCSTVAPAGGEAPVEDI